MAGSTEPGIYVFGPHRLDVSERLLTRNGTPVPLRAKVFDTLVVLVEHAGSLVERADLIDAIWPREIVEEGNLSHNVSALRKALEDGSGTRYVETVPKRGYRFAAPVERADQEHRGTSSALERARRALEQGAWEQAYQGFQEAAQVQSLGADDRQRLARAARWAGRFDELVPLLEQAADACRDEGDPVAAAGVSLDLAVTLLDRRRPALAASYLRQAERLLPESVEPDSAAARTSARVEWLKNRLLWPEGLWQEALAQALIALERSRGWRAREVEALTLMDLGHVSLVLERYDEAASYLAEAAALVTSHEIGDYAQGTVLCGLIFAYRAAGDWARAAEWTDASILWADRVGVAYFPGLCRIHRGELICMRGALADAENDLRRGVEELCQADSTIAGVGLRELGVVRLRRGDLSGAEEAFRRAMEFGMEPQPGLALLRSARGERQEAYQDLVRFLDEAAPHASLFDRQNRALALPVLVTLALDAGQTQRARQALAECEEIAEHTGSAAYRAAADVAAGQVARHEERFTEAVDRLRRGYRAWSALAAPYEAAAAREQLAEALVSHGDTGRAQLELEGAAATFERLGALLDLRRVRRRVRELAPPEARAEMPRRILVYGCVAEAAALEQVLGAAAWEDLSHWLERLLHQCWKEHGGTPYLVPGAHAVSFDRLEDALCCSRFVQASLRDHRIEHGFSPNLQVGVVDRQVALGDGDEPTALELARRVATLEPGPGLVVLADPEDRALEGHALRRSAAQLPGTTLTAFIVEDTGGEGAPPHRRS